MIRKLFYQDNGYEREWTIWAVTLVAIAAIGSFLWAAGQAGEWAFIAALFFLLFLGTAIAYHYKEE